MKLIITGASGFLGRRAAEYFAGKPDKYEVLAPSHGELDITDKSGVSTYFEKNKPDCVLHCAAISGVGDCENSPAETQIINVGGAENIAAACGNVNAKLIFCSSDQVYFGSRVMTPHLETEGLTPLNVYGRQKLEAEALCCELAPQCVCARLTWMYDVKHKDGEKADFLTGLMAAVKSGKAGCFAQSANDMRGLTDVNEVLRGFEVLFDALLKQDADANVCGVYNFGAENAYNMYDTVQKLLEKTNLPQDILAKDANKFADAPRNLCMDNKKAQGAGVHFSDTLTGLVNAVNALK